VGLVYISDITNIRQVGDALVDAERQTRKVRLDEGNMSFSLLKLMHVRKTRKQAATES